MRVVLGGLPCSSLATLSWGDENAQELRNHIWWLWHMCDEQSRETQEEPVEVGARGHLTRLLGGGMVSARPWEVRGSALP